jgi:hypothetical protein
MDAFFFQEVEQGFEILRIKGALASGEGYSPSGMPEKSPVSEQDLGQVFHRISRTDQF